MGQQHTRSVPNWHLQLLQAECSLIAHADISYQHTLITDHNYLQTLQEKACLSIIVFPLRPFQEITHITMEVNKESDHLDKAFTIGVTCKV